MKHLLALCFWLSFVTLTLRAQVKTPDEFLGYALGSHFTPHNQVVAYFNSIAASAPANLKLIEYGKTNEGRPLLVVVVSSADNIARLAQIQSNSLKLANADGADVNLDELPVLVWLSYNVHGNEANSTETAMKTLYALCSGANIEANTWLKNTVVIIDPCLNPDGRDRYVNYFNSVVGKIPNVNPLGREHNEPWPGGRANHYYFDLNRDWAWQTQQESTARLALYHQFMPQIHVDFHEQGYNQPYYFAPAAEPVHKNITDFQKKFQIVVGKNNAKYFDEHGWKYFTKQEFDLLYPSYGDTYPLYNGAIGMTYEQGGIQGGLAILTNDGDTLTLADRINHHFTTGMATVEVASQHKKELLVEFKSYFERGATNPPGRYKSYVIKAENISRLKKLAELLTKNNIKFAFGGGQAAKGFNYGSEREESFTVARNDLIVNLYQPAAVLADVLLEPKTFITDSNTYDITAWALPYVYGLNAYASKESLKGAYTAMELPMFSQNTTQSTAQALAWAFDWGSTNNAQFIVALQKENMKVRQAVAPFSIGDKDYLAGTLVLMRAENERLDKNVASKLTEIANRYEETIHVISTGFVSKGKDFGSDGYPLLTTPKIAVASGEQVSSLAFGEVWFYLEHDLNLQPLIIDGRNINDLNIDEVNVLILPSGNYKNSLGDGLSAWIKKGGRLILMEDAISSVMGKKDFEIKKFDADTTNSEQKPNTTLFLNRNKADFEASIPGAIYKVNLDASHPFAYGIGKSYYSLKTDDLIYKPLVEGANVGQLSPNSLMAGIVGKTVRKSLSTGLLMGTQDFGKGQVVYLATDPLFRNFWEVGKTLFSNIIFCSY